MYTRTLAALALLSGCTKTITVTKTVPAPDTEATGDTGTTAPAPKIITEARFQAFIAWDAALQQIVAPKFDGDDGFISVYAIYLYETGAFAAGDDDGSCQIVIDLTGYTSSTEALLEGFGWGLDIPVGQKEGFDRDCVSKGFDPSNFTDGDPWAATWMPPGWRLRLGGSLAPDTVTWLSDAGFFVEDTAAGVTYDEAYFAAGDWSVEEPPPRTGLATDPVSNFWYGFELDAEGNVTDTRIPLSEMIIGGNLASGYYRFDQSVYFNIDPPGSTTTP